jgi:hypothetical protein
LAGVSEQTESSTAARETAQETTRADFRKGDETDPLPAQARFAAMPAFDAALRAYITGVTGFRRSNRVINKLVSYHARFRLAGYLLYLHADREPSVPTAERPTAICSRCAAGRRTSARAC